MTVHLVPKRSRIVQHTSYVQHVFHASFHYDSRLQQTRLRSSCSLCVAVSLHEQLAVNLHLNDENTDSTMLRWWYVFSNSSGFFSCHLSISALGPNPFTTWFLRVQITGLLPVFADHPAVLVCIVSCIKHHASCAIRNLFDHLPEHRGCSYFLPLTFLLLQCLLPLPSFVFLSRFLLIKSARDP